MADNVPITAGVGTSVAADDIASVFYQRVKLSLGADGTAVDAVAGSGVNGTGVQRVTIATDDVNTTSMISALGAQADAAWASGAGSIIALLKTIAEGSLDTSAIPVFLSGQTEYETVAASATDQILGATGAQGDFLKGILVVPATTSPGAISIKDGNGSAITVFTGGASSVSNLVPFFIPLGIRTVNATTPGWKVTTGTNVSAVGVGDFT